jgi:UDP-N-acetyl-D-glucosamine dehydrogenase
MENNLAEKIRDRKAVVGIIGMGYVGLPLALAFTGVGFKVVGIDIQQKRADLVNRGISFITGISDDELSVPVKNGKLAATTDQSRLSEADVILICVPTPLTRTRDPDLSYVISESKQIARYMRPGQLVVLESTTYPGTTSQVVLPILLESGCKLDEDFFLAYSPEKVDPGNDKFGIRNTPKLVGGITVMSTEICRLLYAQVADTVVPVASPEVAEMTKIFENVFRSVNIALVNELAQLCERFHVSVWDVIDAASTKPFGYMPFYPGPGIGGHCIPLDPYYLANKARELDFHTRFIQLAAEINEDMPYYVVTRIMEEMNRSGKSVSGARVLVLGAAYKKDVNDARESQCVKLIQILQAKGARVDYNDPLLPVIKVKDREMRSVGIEGDALGGYDCVVIATPHSAYDIEGIAGKARLLFDTRGVTRKLAGNNIVRLGE